MRSFCRIQGIMGCTPNSVLILFIVYRLSFGYFKDSLEWESIHWLYIYIIWPILTGVCWQVPPPNFLFLNRGISRHRGSSHRLGAAVCSTGGKYSYRLRLILPKWPNIFFLWMAWHWEAFMYGRLSDLCREGGGSLTWKLAFRNDLKEQFGSQEWWNLFVTVPAFSPFQSIFLILLI